MIILTSTVMKPYTAVYPDWEVVDAFCRVQRGEARDSMPSSYRYDVDLMYQNKIRLFALDFETEDMQEYNFRSIFQTTAFASYNLVLVFDSEHFELLFRLKYM